MATRGRGRALQVEGMPTDHVTEGFPPLGENITTRGGKDMSRLERLRL